MDFDFPATQICDKDESELSQSLSTVGSQIAKKTPVGILTVVNQDYPIYVGVTSIGRHTKNNICIKDSSISKYHAEIEGRRKRSFITDLKSTNGTFEYKEKFLPNRAYELVDGTKIKFGSVECTFKKLNTLDGSLMKSPAVPRSNKIVASTPDSILNSTNDDSSVVYGTQAAQTVSSPSVKKLATPKNLQNEFSRNEDSDRDEDGIFEESTQNVSTKSDAIHEADTQPFMFKSPIQGGNLKKIQDSGELLSDHPCNSISSSFGETEEEPTQACVSRKIMFTSTRISDDPNIVPDSETDDDDEDFSGSMQNTSTKSHKIYDQETQLATSSSRSTFSKQLENENSKAKDPDTDGERVFEEPTQQVTTKSDNIHQETTQAFAVNNPGRLLKQYSKVQGSDSDEEGTSAIAKKTQQENSKLDSDTDEEGVFEEPTQKVSTISDKIHEAETQVVTSPKSRKKNSDTDEGVLEGPTQKFFTKSDKIHEAETQATTSHKSRKEDSDTDEEAIFEGTTQKISTKSDKIHEAETQAITCHKLQKEDSDTDEEGVFEKPTQKLFTKSDKIHDAETQKLFTNPEQVLDAETQKMSTNTDKVLDAETQKISTISDKILDAETQAVTSHQSRKENSYTDEDGIFDGPTQKLFTNSDNILEAETQAVTSHQSRKEDSDTDEEAIFEGTTQKISTKSDKIHEAETQAITCHKLQKEDSDTDEEGVFDGPTQKLFTNSDKILEAETQAVTSHQSRKEDSDTDEEAMFEGTTQKISTKSNKIHEAETQAITCHKLQKEDSDTDEEGVFDGPTQKLFTNSDKIHEAETQATTSHKSRIEDSDTDEEGLFEGPTQKIVTNSKKILEEVTPAYPLNRTLNTANATNQDSNTEADKMFTDPTQKYIAPSPKKIDEQGVFEEPMLKMSTKSDKIHEEETQAITSHKLQNEGSDTDDEGIFERPKRKISTKSVKNHEADTKASPSNCRPKTRSSKKQKLDIKGEEIFLGPQKYTATSSKKNNEITEPRNASPTLNKVLKDPNFVPDSETDKEGMLENKTQKSTSISGVETAGSTTPVLVETDFPKSKTSRKANNVITAIDECMGYSPRSSLKSAAIHEKVEKIILKCESKLKSKRNCISESKSNLETAESGNSKIDENSDSEVESILKNKKEIKDVKQKRFSRRQISMSRYLQPSTSKQDSETSNDIFQKENTSVKKSNKKTVSSKPSTRERKDSKPDGQDNLQTDDSSVNNELEQENISKNPAPKSSRLDRVSKMGNENISQEKASSSKKVISKSPVQKRTRSQKPPTSENVDPKENKKKSFKSSDKSDKSSARKISSKQSEKPGPIDDVNSSRVSIPSPCLDYSLDTRFASIEDLEYETATTQPIDDLETDKAPELKTNSDSKNKGKLSPKTSTRRSVRLNDTIEDNLNQMFQGASEEIEEPDHMLTQQLKNVLEETQVTDEHPQTPSVSRARNSRKIETPDPKKSLEGSFKSQNSPKVGKFHFKASSDFQVVSKKDKSSDESDDDFVPFLPKKVDLNSLISSSFKGLSCLKSNSSSIGGLKFWSRNVSPSTSSEKSFDDSPVKLSPSLSNSKNWHKSVKRNEIRNRKMVLKSIENFNMHEEVEKLTDSDILMENSDDSDFEELQRIANRVLEIKSVYGKNRSAIELKRVRVSLERMNVESPSDFQVNADNCSPRMSMLNIIRTKRRAAEKKVETSVIMDDEQFKVQKQPLKKRPLRSFDDNEPGTSNDGKDKRLKIDENKLDMTTNLNVRQSTSSSQEPKKLTRGRKPKKQTNNEPQIEKPITNRSSKRIAVNSSSSAMEDSIVSNSTSENIKVPSIPKRTRTKKPNVVENKKDEVESKKEVLNTRRATKRQADENDKIIPNTSSSSSNVENSFNEASSSMVDKSLNAEPKKTRGRKKKIVNDPENSRVGNMAASSSMLSVSEPDINSSVASSPSRSKRIRFSSPLKHKVLFTGIAVKDYQKNLTKLGLSDTEDIKKCTVLVTDKVRRTFKFLCAISQGIPIVSVDWITDSAKKSSIQDLEKYIVNDPSAEKKFNFNLSESLQKARDNKMLDGYTVVLTPNLTAPPVTELKGMVIASGGKAVLRPPTKWAANTVIVSDEKDSETAKKFKTKAPETVTIHSTEFLLTGILKQNVDLNSYLLHVK